MKYYNEIEINNLISIKDIIDTVEEYYLTDGDHRSLVPERLFINDGENTALLMPSFYEDYYGAKTIGIAPNNVKINEPTLRGTFLLNDRHTMKPLAIFDARTITALRTGAVSGLSMKYLAKKDANKVGVIGTGDQGWSHLLAACAVRPIEEVFVHNRSKDRLEAFIEKAKQHFGNIKISASSVEELVQEADIITTTTTSVNPVIPEKADYSGKHIAASGAFKSFMQEIPDAVMKKANHIFVDSKAAFSECGELGRAKELGIIESEVMTIQELAKLQNKEHMENQLTVYKSVGQAIFDILTAKLIFERANCN